MKRVAAASGNNGPVTESRKKKADAYRSRSATTSTGNTNQSVSDPPSQPSCHVIPSSIHTELLNLVQQQQRQQQHQIMATAATKEYQPPLLVPTADTLASLLREQQPSSTTHWNRHDGPQMLLGQQHSHLINDGHYLREPSLTLPTTLRNPADVRSLPHSAFAQDSQFQTHLLQQRLDAELLLLRHAQQSVNSTVAPSAMVRVAVNQQQELIRLRNEAQMLQQYQQLQMLIGNPTSRSFATVPTSADIVSNFLGIATTVGLRNIPQQQPSHFAHLLNHQDVGSLPILSSLLYQPEISTILTERSFPQRDVLATRRIRPAATTVAASAVLTVPTQGRRRPHVPIRVVNVINSNSRNVWSLVPTSLPVLLERPEMDPCRRRPLSRHQYFLRQQIEVFEASDDDVTTRTRGRNKQVLLGQVGIRCTHCAHIAVSHRQKGSTYFPSTTLGIYQAAQNMSATHIQCGECRYIPEHTKLQIALILESRHGIDSTTISRNGGNHGTGRHYWANCGSQMGLVDTEHHGIRFVRNLPSDAIILENDYWTVDANVAVVDA